MSTVIRILVVDDSEDDALLLMDELRDNDYQPEWKRVDARQAMTEALSRQTWDIIIADYTMPGFSGPEALKVLHSTGLDIPFILVSGTAPDDKGAELMRSGAQDFVLKNKLSRLVPAVRRELADAETRHKRRLAEQNVARLAAIVEFSEDAIIGKTLDGIITEWNLGAGKMYGYTAAEAIGMPFDIIVPPDRRDESKRFLDMIAHGQPISQQEAERVTKTGERLYVSTSMSPIRDADGHIVGVSTIARDITERRLAEQRVREMEAHKRQFYRRTLLAATEGKLMMSEEEEIRAIAGEPIQSWKIRELHDIETAREEIRGLARELGMDEQRIPDFLGCAVEALANVHKHAGDGVASLHSVIDGLMLVVCDEGRGIEALALPDVALTKGYTTAISLGMGYKVMLEFADRVYLSTGSDGTVVAIQMGLHTGAKRGDVLLDKLMGW